MALDNIFWSSFFHKLREWWCGWRATEPLVTTITGPKPEPLNLFEHPHFPIDATDPSGAFLFNSNAWYQEHVLMVQGQAIGPFTGNILRSCVLLGTEQTIFHPTCPVLQTQPRYGIQTDIAPFIPLSVPPSASPTTFASLVAFLFQLSPDFLHGFLEDFILETSDLLEKLRHFRPLIFSSIVVFWLCQRYHRHWRDVRDRQHNRPSHEEMGNDGEPEAQQTSQTAAVETLQGQAGENATTTADESILPAADATIDNGLRSRVRELETQINDLQTRHESRVSKLKNQLDTSSRSHQSQVDKLEKARDDLQKALNSQQSKVDKLTEENNIAQQSLESHHSTVKELEKRLEDAETKSESQKSEGERLTALEKILKNNLQNERIQSEEFEDRKEKLHKALDAQQFLGSHLEDTDTNLREDLEITTSEVERLEGRVSRLPSAAGSQGLTVEKLKSQIESLERELNLERLNVETLRGENEDLKSQQSKVDQLRNENKDVDEKLHTQGSTVDTLRNEKKDFEEKLDIQPSELDNLKTENNDLRRDLQSKIQDVENAKADCNDVLKTMHKNFMDELANKDRAMEKLNDSLSSSKYARDHADLVSQRIIKCLENRVEQQEVDIAQLRESPTREGYESLKDEVKSLENESNKKSKEIKELERTLEELCDQVQTSSFAETRDEALRAEHRQLQERLEAQVAETEKQKEMLEVADTLSEQKERILRNHLENEKKNKEHIGQLEAQLDQLGTARDNAPRSTRSLLQGLSRVQEEEDDQRYVQSREELSPEPQPTLMRVRFPPSQGGQQPPPGPRSPPVPPPTGARGSYRGPPLDHDSPGSSSPAHRRLSKGRNWQIDRDNYGKGVLSRYQKYSTGQGSCSGTGVLDGSVARDCQMSPAALPLPSSPLTQEPAAMGERAVPVAPDQAPAAETAVENGPEDGKKLEEADPAADAAATETFPPANEDTAVAGKVDEEGTPKPEPAATPATIQAPAAPRDQTDAQGPVQPNDESEPLSATDFTPGFAPSDAAPSSQVGIGEGRYAMPNSQVLVTTGSRRDSVPSTTTQPPQTGLGESKYAMPHSQASAAPDSLNTGRRSSTTPLVPPPLNTGRGRGLGPRVLPPVNIERRSSIPGAYLSGTPRSPLSTAVSENRYAPLDPSASSNPNSRRGSAATATSMPTTSRPAIDSRWATPTRENFDRGIPRMNSTEDAGHGGNWTNVGSGGKKSKNSNDKEKDGCQRR